jgi:hypothetical protein
VFLDDFAAQANGHTNLELAEAMTCPHTIDTCNCGTLKVLLGCGAIVETIEKTKFPRKSVVVGYL